MILRHALARAALPVARRSLATTSLALASRHTRTRPSRASLQQPRRHPAAAPHSTPAEEALTPTPEESELPPVSRLPAHVPHDSNGIIDSASYSSAEQLRQMLAQPALVVGRQMEMMNIFLGYEQANRYHITSSTGELLGYLMEEDSGIGSAIKRQMLRTHRPFKATVLSKEGQVLLIVSSAPCSAPRPDQLTLANRRSVVPSPGSIPESTFARPPTTPLRFRPPHPLPRPPPPPSPSPNLFPLLKLPRTRSLARRNKCSTYTGGSTTTSCSATGPWNSSLRLMRAFYPSTSSHATSKEELWDPLIGEQEVVPLGERIGSLLSLALPLAVTSWALAEKSLRTVVATWCASKPSQMKSRRLWRHRRTSRNRRPSSLAPRPRLSSLSPSPQSPMISVLS